MPNADKHRAELLSRIKIDYVRRATEDFLQALPYATPEDAIKAGVRTFDEWLELLDHHRNPQDNPKPALTVPKRLPKRLPVKTEQAKPKVVSFSTRLSQRHHTWLRNNNHSKRVRQLVAQARAQKVSLSARGEPHELCRTTTINLYPEQHKWLLRHGGAPLLRQLIDEAMEAEAAQAS